MKDLKRYITKKDKIKYRRNIKLNFDYDNPTDVEFLAYCAFNSFEKLDNYAENFVNYLGTEEYLVLVFHTFNANAYEDYDLPETFVKDLMLDALFPNYKFDDIEVYFESCFNDKDEEYWKENIDLIYDFLDKHGIKHKFYNQYIENDWEALDSSSIYMYIIQSKYLAKIYHDPELKGLFESAVCGEFISPTKYFYFEQLWDGYMEESHIDRRYFISFVEAYKKKMKKKRECKYNYEYANQLVEISYYYIEYGEEPVISCLLDNFDTKTEVMF